MFENIDRYNLFGTCGEKNNFIEMLKSKWDELHEERNVFRYRIDKLQERIVDGKYLLQLNPDRAAKRRTPELIENICQPFDPHKFNFTKVSQEEILFELVHGNKHDVPKHLVVINASPISRYHSLLCPSVAECLPQVITEDSIALALEVMFHAQERDLRIGFNSLCAMASLNHLHYHLFLEAHDLPVENATCKHLKGPVYYFNDQLAPAFCFEATKDTIKYTTSNVFKLARYFIDNSIAHNVMITRGKRVTEDTKSEKETVTGVTKNEKNTVAEVTKKDNDSVIEFTENDKKKVRDATNSETETVNTEGNVNEKNIVTERNTDAVSTSENKKINDNLKNKALKSKYESVKTVGVVGDHVTKIAEKVTEVAEKVTKVADKVTKVAEEVTKVTNNEGNVTRDVENVTKVTNNEENVTRVAEDVTKVADKVTKVAENITKCADNVTNAADEVPKAPNSDFEIVRVVIWPRKSSAGVKQLIDFNVALCELSGWFPVFNTEAFKNLTTEDLESELRKWRFEDFEKLREDIKYLF